jgi:hypothetical protein
MQKTIWAVLAITWTMSAASAPGWAAPAAGAGAPSKGHSGGGASGGGGGSTFESAATLTADCPIDKLVLARLDQLGIKPSHVCSDSVFLRRAYLDVIGTLPSEVEARAFLTSTDPDKRRVLIDQLLERDEFADYWAMKWGDLLRIKAEFPINLWPNAAQAYHRWVRTALRDNQPYDQFVRALLTASGSNFRVPQVNFYRAIQDRKPEGIAQAVALTFMGERAENWPQDKLAAMGAFFAHVGYKATGEWKEEIVYFDFEGANPAPVQAPAVAPDKPVFGPATFPDGTHTTLSGDQDPREVFADWLVDPRNPWFARNIVNRTWYWLLGRGIIHEPDDIRPDNPASNPELLTYLEKQLVSAHYDLKQIYRLILNSKTYQLSSIPAARSPEAAANFAYYPLRRLEAEVLMDALCQISGTGEKYSSAIPEPFTYLPDNQRSVAIPDGSITSSFLEAFGRSPRDTGLESERNNRPSSAQRLYLLNSSHIQGKIDQGKALQGLLSLKKPRDIVEGLYVTILSRFPTDDEMKTAEAFFQAAGANKTRGANTTRDAAVDLAWALINSSEFMYRH